MLDLRCHQAPWHFLYYFTRPQGLNQVLLANRAFGLISICLFRFWVVKDPQGISYRVYIIYQASVAVNSASKPLFKSSEQDVVDNIRNIARICVDHME